jgi:hypothetical protein
LAVEAETFRALTLVWNRRLREHADRGFQFRLIETLPRLLHYLEGTMRSLLALIISAGFLSGLSSAAAQTIVRGPYLQNGTPSQVTIRWRTDVETPTRVTWRAIPSSSASEISKHELVRDHSATLTNLLPNSSYTYSVNLPSGATSLHTFKTAPTNQSESFKVWVLGDAGSSGTVQSGEAPAQSAVRDAFLKKYSAAELSFMLFLGDNAYQTGTDIEYQRAMFSVYQNTLSSLVSWSTQGNHDETANAYYDVFSFPEHGEAGGVPSGTERYYSFDFSNAHFISLNSFIDEKPFRAQMIEWLRRDLASNKKKWTVALFHHAPYSAGSHDSDLSTKHEAPMKWMRENVVPILEQGGVDLVMAGHSHGYERSKLLDGHYGSSSTFSSTFVKDGSSGDPRQEQAYKKLGISAVPHSGTVYVVAGNGGAKIEEPGRYPGMQTSNGKYGSVLLEFSPTQLTSSMIDSDGEVADHFAIVKDDV